MSAVLFREQQSFHLGLARFTLALPPLALLVVTLRQIVWHQPWGNPPVTDGNLVFFTVLTLAVYARLTTVRLVTELRPEQLRVKMKGFWRHTQVPVSNIASATAVEFDLASEYRGYGVRNGPRGKAFLAAGNRGVQLELRDGGKLLVGSQRAEELARRIAEARRRV